MKRANLRPRRKHPRKRHLGLFHRPRAAECRRAATGAADGATLGGRIGLCRRIGGRNVCCRRHMNCSSMKPPRARTIPPPYDRCLRRRPVPTAGAHYVQPAARRHQIIIPLLYGEYFGRRLAGRWRRTGLAAVAKPTECTPAPIRKNRTERSENGTLYRFDHRFGHRISRSKNCISPYNPTNGTDAV